MTKFIQYSQDTQKGAYKSLENFCKKVLEIDTTLVNYPTPRYYDDLTSSIYEENA
jgi:hypothetical protein